MNNQAKIITKSSIGINPGDAQNAFIKKAIKHLEDGNIIAAKVALQNALAFSKVTLTR